MKLAPPLLLLAPFAVASLLGGCTPESWPGDDAEIGASDDEVRGSCASPRKYFATFREGTGACEPIAGRGGRWLPEPLFPDAPADVQASTCAFRWSGEKFSRPDRDSLRTRLGPESGLAPACGADADASRGDLLSIPDIGVFGHGGSVGCDVCGIVRGREVFVVLPPEKLLLKRFAVHLSSGEERAFQLTGTEGRAVSVTLPDAPLGTDYLQGRIKVF